jgi:hypothetical protein
MFWLALFFAMAAETGIMISTAVKQDFPLTADATSPVWRNAPKVVITTGRWGEPVGGSRTEVRSVWTPRHLYFLFINHYESQHLKPNPSTTEETWGLWDYDVAEVFIGHDLENIHRYKEFEVSPQSEWVDLDVDKSKQPVVDWKWNSHFKFANKVDEKNRIWYSEMQIPWESIAVKPPAAGQEFRLNLYRIEGKGEGRRYLAWRPVNNPSYHTPEAFGRLRLR